MRPSQIGYSVGCRSATSSISCGRDDTGSVANQRSSASASPRARRRSSTELRELRARRDAVEAADLTPTGFTERPPSRIRMRLPSLRSRSARSTSRRCRRGDLDAVVEVQEVRRVQEDHVEQMALDPLAGVVEAPERAHLRVQLDAPGRLDRVDRAHLIRHRADAADARQQIGQLAARRPRTKRFEEARRFVDLEAQVHDLAVLDAQVQGAFAFDARERADVDRARLSHELVSRASARVRNSRRQPLMWRRRRSASARDRPDASKWRTSDAGFASAAGPKQP